MSPRPVFDNNILTMVATAIVNTRDITLTHREANKIVGAAVDAVMRSKAPTRTAREVINALTIGKHWANFGRAEVPAQALLNGVEVQIRKARDDRKAQLKPRFTLAEHQRAAQILRREINRRMTSDANFPPLWKDAFMSIRGNKEGALVTYDYEFLAGGRGEDQETEAFVAYLRTLIATVPALKKYQGMAISTYGPPADDPVG